MDKVRVEVGMHFNDRLDEPFVEIGDYVPKPTRIPTEAELNSVPDTFRCFMCQGKFSKRYYMGQHHHQRLCQWCYPNTTEWGIGRLILFDLRHSKPVEGYGKANKPAPYRAPIEPLDEARAVLVAEYSKNGYLSDTERQALERAQKEKSMPYLLAHPYEPRNKNRP